MIFTTQAPLYTDNLLAVLRASMLLLLCSELAYKYCVLALGFDYEWLHYDSIQEEGPR